jgi:hypothetical protein
MNTLSLHAVVCQSHAEYDISDIINKSPKLAQHGEMIFFYLSEKRACVCFPYLELTSLAAFQLFLFDDGLHLVIADEKYKKGIRRLPVGCITVPTAEQTKRQLNTLVLPFLGFLLHSMHSLWVVFFCALARASGTRTR